MEADRDDIPGSLTRSSGHGRRGSLTQGPPDRQQATGVGAQCGAGTPDSFTFDFCNIRGLLTVGRSLGKRTPPTVSTVPSQ